MGEQGEGEGKESEEVEENVEEDSEDDGQGGTLWGEGVEVQSAGSALGATSK